MSLSLFVLSGIGGDERLFDGQRAVRDVRPIKWVTPMDDREPLTHYAARLAREIQVAEPFDLGGSSFGGMIALELARHVSPRQVFLFGSCRSPDAVAPFLRALRPIAAYVRPSGSVWYTAHPARYHRNTFVRDVTFEFHHLSRGAQRLVFGFAAAGEVASAVGFVLDLPHDARVCGRL